MIYYGPSENDVKTNQGVNFDSTKGIGCNKDSFSEINYNDECYCSTTFQKSDDENYERWAETTQTLVFVSKGSTVLSWQVLYNENRDNKFQINAFQISLKERGKISISTSNIDNSLYQPKYLAVTTPELPAIDLYISCSFLMHPEGDKCVDNEPQ